MPIRSVAPHAVQIPGLTAMLHASARDSCALPRHFTKDLGFRCDSRFVAGSSESTCKKGVIPDAILQSQHRETSCPLLRYVLEKVCGKLEKDRIRRETGEYYTITPSGVVHVVWGTELRTICSFFLCAGLTTETCKMRSVR